MPETYLRLVKIFLGTPGGLDDIRLAARRVVDEINQSHSDRWGCQIKLVGWELTLPGIGRAQDLINKDLDECEYFVGVVWDHWGSSPTINPGKYTSGFHEEFDRAKGHVQAKRMKRIDLYFRDISPEQLKDPGPSLTKVLAFRTQCERNKDPLFKTFKDRSDFEPLFRMAIEDIGWSNSKFEVKRDQNEAVETAPTLHRTLSSDSSENHENRLLEVSSSNFIRDLLGKPLSWDGLSSYEVARFRLIASSLSRHGNDAHHIGVHDANIIFSLRQEHSLSHRELEELVDTGVAGLDHGNIPLWHWLKLLQSEGESTDRIAELAVFGQEQERVNALRLLQNLRLPTPRIAGYFETEQAVRSWLSPSSPAEVKRAAIKFLTENGSSKDVPIIKSMMTDMQPNDLSAAESVIIAIEAQTNQAVAFERMIAANPESIENSIVQRLFVAPSSIKSEVLTRCLALRSDLARRRAVEILRDRRQLSVEQARSLIADKEYSLRLVGIQTLASKGIELEEALVKKALIKQEGMGLLSLRSDDRFFRDYKLRTLTTKSYDQARAAVAAAGPLDYLEVRALAIKHWSKAGNEIRNWLDDGFEKYFSEKVDSISRRISDVKLIADLKSLSSMTRTLLVAGALDGLCLAGRAEDLALVRQSLDHFDVEFHESIIDYFKTHGEWEDITRLLKIGSRGDNYASLLSLGYHQHAREIASAVLRIGSCGIADLLSIELPQPIRCSILAQLSKTQLSSMDDNLILQEFRNVDELCRKVLALQCVLCFSKKRLTVLLKKYFDSGSNRFYNVVHWLDCGISASRTDSRNVATAELGRYRGRDL